VVNTFVNTSQIISEVGQIQVDVENSFINIGTIMGAGGVFLKGDTIISTGDIFAKGGDITINSKSDTVMIGGNIKGARDATIDSRRQVFLLPYTSQQFLKKFEAVCGEW
jgi:hypothetical protein